MVWFRAVPSGARRGTGMRDLFWLSEGQMARLAPLLPTDTRGKPRVDDRPVQGRPSR
jgi:hypothetical protein